MIDLLVQAIERNAARVSEHIGEIAGAADATGCKHVHQTRVGLRRIRTMLRVFAPVIDDAWALDVWSKAKAAGAHLGPLRDADVALGRIRAAVDEVEAPSKGIDDVVGRAERERRKTHARAVAHLGAHAGNFAPGWIGTPVVDASEDVIVDLARATAAELRAALVDLDGTSAPSRLHEARLATKKARYAVEVVAPAVDPAGTSFTDAAAKLQGQLGDINDAVVLQKWLRRAVPKLGRKGAFAAGAIAQHEAFALQAGMRSWLEARDTCLAADPWPPA